jgi:hypothetical protein
MNIINYLSKCSFTLYNVTFGLPQERGSIFKMGVHLRDWDFCEILKVGWGGARSHPRVLLFQPKKKGQ